MSRSLISFVDKVYIDHSYINGCDCIYSNHWPLIIDININNDK